MINATYSEQWLQEFQGNPLIEALPLKADDKTVLEKMAELYPIEETVRELKKFKREDFLYRLKRFRQPLPDYLACFRMIERAMRESYCPRNPLSPETTHYLHHLEYDEAEIVPYNGVIAPEGTALTLVGESGIGKTKMLEQVLKCYPQTIKHTRFQGAPCPITQIVWIKVNCPHNSSLTGLCRAVLKEIDRAMRRPLTRPHKLLDSLIEQIEMQARNHFVGIIVLDEMQNLSLQKAGGKDEFIRFILNLINRSGIPMLFCANPAFIDVVRSEFKTARRSESAGFIFMRRMSKEVWDIFVPTLWSLQVTNVHTPLTQALSDRLYRYSQGIVDVAVRIFEKMQVIAMDGKDETLAFELIDIAYEEACQLTNRGLELLREANLDPVSTLKRKQLNETYDDLIADVDYEFLIDASLPEHQDDMEMTKAPPSATTVTNQFRHVQIAREGTKDPLANIHHPELESQILNLLAHPQPAELIVETDLITQMLADEHDPRYDQLILECLGDDE